VDILNSQKELIVINFNKENPFEIPREDVKKLSPSSVTTILHKFRTHSNIKHETLKHQFEEVVKELEKLEKYVMENPEIFI
jgi:hypothetical protein